MGVKYGTRIYLDDMQIVMVFGLITITHGRKVRLRDRGLAGEVAWTRLGILKAKENPSHALRLCLLPLVCRLEQAGKFGSGLVVCGEYIVHVLLVSVVLQLAALLDTSGHLFFDLLDILGRSVCVFE